MSPSKLLLLLEKKENPPDKQGSKYSDPGQTLEKGMVMK